MRYECEFSFFRGVLRIACGRAHGHKRRHRASRRAPGGGRRRRRRDAGRRRSGEAQTQAEEGRAPDRRRRRHQQARSGADHLLASAAGSPESKKIVGELAPGKKIVVHLTHDKDCLFDLHGDYEDGSTTDAVGVALCKDKTINLTE